MQHTVDAEHVERLGKEFAAAAELMNDFARRLARTQGAVANSYGSLPDSEAAAEHHDQVVRSALDYLKKLEDAYYAYSRQLSVTAREYEATEDDNADLAARVAAGS
jgi:hypothetical protein